MVSKIPTAAISHQIVGEGSRLTPRVAGSALSILRTAFETAILWRILDVNPAIGVTAPLVEHEEIRPLSPDQVIIFLEAAKIDPLYSLFLLAIFTQLREGELLALRVADVDLEQHVIRVRRKLDARTREFGSVKRWRSNRPIDISPEDEAALRPLIAGKAHSALLFHTRSNKPLPARNVVRSFKRIIAALNAKERERTGDAKAELVSPKTRFQDLRHTGGTLLLAAGVHPKIVQERLGHESMKTTLDIYTHYLPTLGREAAQALRRYLPAHYESPNGVQIGVQAAGSNRKAHTEEMQNA